MTTIDREMLWSILLGLTCLGLFFTLVLTAGVILAINGTRRAQAAFERWMMPNPPRLRTRLAELHQRYPTLSQGALVEKIIVQQSLKAGLAGALTGWGGIVTLPIAIPVDFALSTQLQTGLIHFIAEIYAPGQPPEKLRAQTYLILAGNRFTQQAIDASSRAAQAALARLLTRLLAETVAESLLKVVPVVGGLVGFVFGYATTRATGALAARWYRSDPRIGDPRIGDLQIGDLRLGELRLPGQARPPE